MTRAELEHAIRAACDVAGDDEVFVFGSQAILGQYPDAHEALRQSAEADISPVRAVDKVDDIDACLGELSPFHEAYGFYVHGVSIEAAVLPAGCPSLKAQPSAGVRSGHEHRGTRGGGAQAGAQGAGSVGRTAAGQPGESVT